MRNQMLLLLTVALTAGILFKGSGQHDRIIEVHRLSSSSHAALLHTSMKKEKGKYTRQAKELFGGLLDHLESH
ncbi:hypothetical protein [Paenibacillus pedocola]|uniref:hypothetical protein n=1 Tax=Paenibacillus pedocola TaxID=3242193 RepID=UPI002877F38A|nr:hypothetical protein [Paenibacillus typhae]